MRILTLVFLFVQCLHVVSINAQSELRIGEWKSHLPYQRAEFVTQSATKAFIGTEEAVLIFDKEESSVDFLDKVNGLSETGIQDLLYDDFNDQLIIAYSNSVFDLVKGSDVFKISDIADKSDIQGDKNIYDLYIQDGKYLYLATGFGLVQFNLESLEFGFTLDISKEVSKVDGDGDLLIIEVEGQAFVLDLTTTNTPAFFNEWSLLEEGLPDADIVDVFIKDDNIYLATEEEIYLGFVDEPFESIYQSAFSSFKIILINPTPEGWLLGMRHREAFGNSKVLFFDGANSRVGFIDDCTSRLIDVIIDQEGRIFFADMWEGIRYRLDIDAPCERLEINSPGASTASDISIVGDRVFFASGGITENFADLFGNRGAYLFEQGEWVNYSSRMFPFMSEREVLQVFKAEVHPSQNKLYLASFWAGLAEYDMDADSFELFNEQNSSLRFQIGDPRVRISGLEFDQEENLWISNYSAERPISVLSNEGLWFSFEIEASDNKVEDIIIDDNGFAWIMIGGTAGGLVIYDKGENLADPTDDVQRFISASELETNFVFSGAVDRSGSVWIGTSSGAYVFECGTAATDRQSCAGTRRKVLQDSIVAFLLESEEVLSIAVDGADRKWFGTRNGIFVQSPDGEEQIAKFDTENSPLFDNTISALAYEEKEGLMYIATNKGMQSIRTETTGGSVFHSSNVYAYPNPVRADYSGPVAIKGLARDAEVRITDLDGKLVSKTKALGGQAIWDGLDVDGNAVAGGVYLVFSSSTEQFADIDTYVTKILILK